MRGVLLVLLLAGVARADGPVEVQARAEPERVTIGTPFRYVVEVLSAPGTEIVVEQPAERIGDFEILDFGVDAPVAREGKTVLARWYRLVGFDPGERILPSPAVRYREGEELKDVPGRETRVTVESLLAQTPDASDIRDIKPPEPIPVDWRPWYAAGAAVAVLALAGLLVRRLRGRRPARAGGAAAGRRTTSPRRRSPT
jgi:hypothetical protein